MNEIPLVKNNMYTLIHIYNKHKIKNDVSDKKKLAEMFL